jgi:hypothetical protein
MRVHVVIAVLVLAAFTGCQSKQARTAKLQDAYNKAHQKYYNDCIAPAYGGKSASAALGGTAEKPPTPQKSAAQQQKCIQEAKEAGELQKQIEAASQ